MSRALADYNSCLTKVNKMEVQLNKEKSVQESLKLQNIRLRDTV